MFVAALLFLAAATGCNGCLGMPSPTDPKDTTLPKSCDEAPPALPPQKIDVLFVIDNSGSMQEEQDGVARELTAFVEPLRVLGGVRQDLRVGVITTSVYERWRDPDTGFERFESCSPTDSTYCAQAGRLQPVPGTSERLLDSTDDQLIPKLAQLVRQGTSGSGQETPFEALRLALSPPLSELALSQGGNAGFLRDGARLMIVVLTDEDDCSERAVRPPRLFVADRKDIDFCGGSNANSLTPVSEYRDFLAGLKDSRGAPKDITFAVIGPVGVGTKEARVVVDTSGPATIRNIDCATSWGAGIRLRAMAEAFDGQLLNLDSICQAGYAGTLRRLAGLLEVRQVLEVQGVTDPDLIRFEFTRADGSLQSCTRGGGDLTFQAATPEQPAFVTFGASCLRRRDDQQLKIERLCVY